MLEEARQNSKFNTLDIFIASRLKQIVTQADWRMSDIIESYNIIYEDEKSLMRRNLIFERIRSASSLQLETSNLEK